MHTFEYRESWKQLLTPEIVSVLIRIHEAKGKQTQLLLNEGEALLSLKDEARAQSIKASNSMEGIRVREVRFKPLVTDKIIPDDDAEKLLAGYRNTIRYISDGYEYSPMTPTYILQLHQQLFQFYSGVGDRFRSKECGQAIEELCRAYDDAIQAGVDQLLIIPTVVLDFLNIRPFEKGNGQMSRLLLLLLLYRAGYGVGRYVSLEHLMDKQKAQYESVFFDSSMNWNDDQNDSKSITEYLLKIIDSAYSTFFQRAENRLKSGYTKANYIRDVLRESSTGLSKQDLMNKCQDISEITIKRALRELVVRNEIRMHGKARATTYTYIGERE